MKKILLIALIASLSIIFIVGCNDSNVESYKIQDEKSVKETKNEPTQEEISEKLKKEAVKANFVEINGHADEKKGLRVFAEGKISVVDYDKVMDLFPSFLLSQNEGDGYGVYHITNILDVKGLKNGDIVRIYGTVDGEEEGTGMPKIVAIIIEKIK